MTEDTTAKSVSCLLDSNLINSFCATVNNSKYCDLTLKTKSEEYEVHHNKSNNFSLSDQDRNNKSTVMQMGFHNLVFQSQLSHQNIEQKEKCLSMHFDDLPYCDVQKQFPCSMVCDSLILTDVGKPVDEDSMMNHYQFWVFALLTLLSWSSMEAITPLVQTLCFGVLADRPNEFGKQRLWGSFGWGIMSLVAGILVDFFSNGRAIKNYTPLFITSAGVLVAAAAATSFVKETKRETSANIMLDVGKLLLHVKVLVYILWCVIMGMFNGLQMNFLFWHLEDLTNCDGLSQIKTIEGLYVALQCFCGELPFFFLNAWILKKIGHINVMSVTLFLYGAIFLLFSFLNNPLYFLPLSLFNGVAFSTMHSTLVSYASILSPPGTEATVQSLVGAIHDGLGVSLGIFIAGIFMSSFKGAKTFRIYGIAGLILCVLHIAVQFLLSESQDSDLKQSVKYHSPEQAAKMTTEAQEESKEFIPD